MIRVSLPGLLGNIMFMHMTAQKLAAVTGDRQIVNVHIPEFNIYLPDVPTEGLRTLHVQLSTEIRTGGLVNFDAIRSFQTRSAVDLFQLEGFCQNVGNLLHRTEYEAIYPRLSGNKGGGPGELVISIRGGEVLEAVHPSYTILPYDWYEHVVATSGLKPIFFGQIAENSYIAELRRRFPRAEFRAGTGAAEDFDFIRKSHNIAVSVSTFSWLAAWLSDASRVILPISGLLHPNQHKASMLVPFSDPRYEFYLFPQNYAITVDRFEETNQAMRGRWQKVDGETLIRMFGQPSRFPRRIGRYLQAFRPRDYAEIYADQQHNLNAHGEVAVFDHYFEQGFDAGRWPCWMDTAWYCRTYPDAAVAVGHNLYFDEMHHFVEVGRECGYLPHPKATPF